MGIIRSESADLELRIAPYKNTYGLTLRFLRPEDAADIQRGPFQVSIDIAHLRGLEGDPFGYGAALSTAVFAEPPSLNAFAEAQAAGLSKYRYLRVRLLLPQELHTIRWETLLNPRSNQFIAVESNLLLSRYLTADDYQPIVLPEKHELSALLAVAAPTDAERYGLTAIDATAEIGRIKRTLTTVSLSVLGENNSSPATWENLAEGLRSGSDILYLVAHGTIRNETPWFYLTDQALLTTRHNGMEFATLVRSLESRRPRLVVLASCESAGNGYMDALAAFGPQLVQAGVPAVLAMQGRISTTTAEQFMNVFFQELLLDGYVDRAIAAARLAVTQKHDWWMPVLYSRLHKGRVWEQASISQNTPKPVRLSSAQIQALVRALLACDMIADWTSRDSILSLLPQQVRVAVRRDRAARIDVLNIVNTCIAYPGALALLVQSVYNFEDGTANGEALLDLARHLSISS